MCFFQSPADMLATDGDAADVAVRRVAEECLIGKGVVDVESVDGVSVASEGALVGCV